MGSKRLDIGQWRCDMGGWPGWMGVVVATCLIIESTQVLSFENMNVELDLG